MANYTESNDIENHTNLLVSGITHKFYRAEQAASPSTSACKCTNVNKAYGFADQRLL